MTQPAVRQTPEYWRRRTSEVAEQWGMDPSSFVRQINMESGFAEDVVYGPRVSTAGAQGIAQFMPATAADYGIDPYNPEEALQGAAHYMTDLYDQFGNWQMAAGSYVWGQGNVQRMIDSYGDDWLSYAPDDVKDYIQYIFQGAALEQSFTPPPIERPRAPYQRADEWAPEIPEFFPNYRKMLRELLEGVELSGKEVEATYTPFAEASSRYVAGPSEDEIRAEVDKRLAAMIPLMSIADKLREGIPIEERAGPGYVPLPVGFYSGATGVATTAAVRAELRRQMKLGPEVDAHLAAVENYQRIATLAVLLQWLPLAMASGDVRVVDDVDKFFQEAGLKIPAIGQFTPITTPGKLDPRDKDLVSFWIQKLGPAIPTKPDVSVAEVTAAMLEEHRPEPRVWSSMTADQISRIFAGGGGELPVALGLTEDELRGIYEDMEGDYNEMVADTKHAATRLSQDWYNQYLTTEMYKAGIKVPEIPKLSGWEKLKMAVTQPLLLGGMGIDWYRRMFAIPISSEIYRGISGGFERVGLPPIRGAPGLQEEYDKARAAGAGAWEANVLAYEEWEAPGIAKLALEIGGDPVSYLGFGVTRPFKGIPVIGPLLWGIERGWIRMWDIALFGPLRILKAATPKTVQQLARKQGEHVLNLFNDTFASRMGRMEGLLGAEASEQRQVAAEAIREFVTHPGGPSNKMWEAGRALVKSSQRLISEREARAWSKVVSGTSDVTRQMVHDINYIYEQMAETGIHGFLKTSEAAPQMLRILGAEDSVKMVTAMSRLLQERMSSDIAAITNSFAGGSGATALVGMTDHVQSVYTSNARSGVWKFAEQTGMAQNLARWSDKVLNWRVLTMLDKYVVRPPAYAYLIFTSYGPFNWLETVFRGGRAGSGLIMRPGEDAVHILNRRMGYLDIGYEMRVGAPRMEVAVTAPFGDTIMPMSQRPQLVSSAKTITPKRAGMFLWDLVNPQGAFARLGTNQRATYLQRKWQQTLVDLSPDAIRKVNEALPNLHKLGLKSFTGDSLDILAEDIWYAAVYGPDGLRGMKSSVPQFRSKKYVGDVSNVVSGHPNVDPSFQNVFIRRAQQGTLAGNEDTITREVYDSIRDHYMTRFAQGGERLKMWADDMAEGLGVSLRKGPGNLKEVESEVTGIVNEFHGDYFSEGRRFHVEIARDVGKPDVARIQIVEAMEKGPGRLTDIAEDLGRDIRDLGFKDIDWVPVLDGRPGSRERLFQPIIDDIKSMLGKVETPEQVWSSVKHLDDMVGAIDESVSTFYGMTTERAHDLHGPAADKLHEAAADEMETFFRTASDQIDRTASAIKATISEASPEADRGFLTGLVDNLQEQDQLMLAWRQSDRAIILRNKAMPGKVNWDVINAERHVNWASYKEGLNRVKRHWGQMAESRGVPFGTIEPVTGGLAPVHVARLFATTGDDLSRGLVHIETMTIMPKDEFVGVVKNKADRLAGSLGKTADELGFTDDAIGSVYDQLLAKIRMDPATAHIMEPMRMELEAIRHELHGVAATRKVVPEEIEAFNAAMEESAVKLEGTGLFQRVGEPGPSLFHGSPTAELHESLTDVPGIYMSSSKEEASRFATNVSEVHVKPEVRFVEYTGDEYQAILTGPRMSDAEIASALKAKGYGGIHVPPGSRPGLEGDVYMVFDRSSMVSGPSPGGRWEATTSWEAQRNKAMDQTRMSYQLDFTDYSNENMVDAFMRRIYPFWTYEAGRWPWLARTFLQTPGVAHAWGAYMDLSDTGYMHIPTTDFQINPFRGTVFMGGMRRFVIRDYPEYYDQFGMFPEIMDFAGRAGFYPGLHVTLPMAIFGFTDPATGMQLGEVLPATARTGLAAMVALNLPGAKSLQNIIFPDRFRSYQIGATVSKIAQQRGLEDINGARLHEKKLLNEDFTDEEQAIWDEAEKHIARMSILFEQTGLFRLRSEERIRAYDEVTTIYEALTGVPKEQQDIINRRSSVTGERFSDLFPLDPTQQEQLNELDYFKYWAGVTAPLIPSHMQRVYAEIGSYWDERIKIGDRAKTDGFLDKQGNVVAMPLDQLYFQWTHGTISSKDYIRMSGETIEEMVARGNALSQEERYADVPVTLDERLEFAEEHNLPQPTFHPGQELLWEYYQLAPVLRWDDDAQAMIYDFDTYYAQVNAILGAMPEPIKSKFVTHIHRDWDPARKLRWEVSREYMRPYNNLREAVIQQYTPEEQLILAQYPRAEGPELEAMKEVLTASGDKLIANFESQLKLARDNMRRMDARLDAWMYFWGKTTTFKSKHAESIYHELMKLYRPQVDIEQFMPSE